MVRYINCVKRLPGISAVEFAKYWNDDQFTRLIERTASLYNAKKWNKSQVLTVEANIKILDLRDSQPPYDGIIEYYWNRGSDLMNIFESEKGAELYREMTGYQSPFVDFDNSLEFFTEA